MQAILKFAPLPLIMMCIFSMNWPSLDTTFGMVFWGLILANLVNGGYLLQGRQGHDEYQEAERMRGIRNTAARMGELQEALKQIRRKNDKRETGIQQETYQIADEEAYRYADEQVVLGRFQRSLETARAAHNNFGVALTVLPLDRSTAGLAMESD